MVYIVHIVQGIIIIDHHHHHHHCHDLWGDEQEISGKIDGEICGVCGKKILEISSGPLVVRNLIVIRKESLPLSLFYRHKSQKLKKWVLLDLGHLREYI